MSRSDLVSCFKGVQRTWLVTGVAGFIGSNLAERLLSAGQKVIGLDNFSTGKPQNIEELLAGVDSTFRKNFKFLEGDIRDLDTCENACRGAEYVLHQAALGSVPRSVSDPITTNSANVTGFLNMLVAARDSGVLRFVYAASSSTYGDHPALPKVEETIGKPLSPYAVTKLVNEIYAEVFFRTYGLQSIGLRYFNVFGSRQDPDGAYAAVIPKWVSSLLKGEVVYINGDGETSRDFCYIDNVVQANFLAAIAENPSAVNQVYNVAVGERTTLNMLFNKIKNELIARKAISNDPSPVYRDFRSGDVRHSLADVSKAQSLLGYVPSHRLSEGLDIAMDWYVNHLYGIRG